MEAIPEIETVPMESNPEDSSKSVVPWPRGSEGEMLAEYKKTTRFVELPVKYKNTPRFVDTWLVRSLASCAKFRDSGRISAADARVHSLPHLNLCPIKSNTRICTCVELSHGAMTAFQDDIRMLYCRVVQLASRKIGNQLLMSMMVDRRKKTDLGLVFKVPGITFDFRARVFYLCRQQFCNLFGLSSKRCYKLMKERRKQLDQHNLSIKGPQLFGWTEKEKLFTIRGDHYLAFRSEYWIDYMVQHGGYDASDNFS